MLAIRSWLGGYVGASVRDARAALGRVARDRASMAAIVFFLLPWLAPLFLHQDLGWVAALVEIAGVGLIFWWMSRSGMRPFSTVKRPRLESFLAIALVVLWVEWRTAICGEFLFFLPSGFKCFDNVEYEIIPKVLEGVVFPFCVLWFAGYRWREQGLALDLRAWWIALPVIVALAGYGLYLHLNDPAQFGAGIATYFFAAGLPEEYLFRAFLLTRLEAWWRSPGWALFGAAAIFGLSHLAIDYLVFTKRNWSETWILASTFQMGFGFVFAFAYQRTRNIWPIAVVHAMVDAL